MKVARFGRVRPALTASEFFGSITAGPPGQALQSIGSNTVSWGSNVAIITSNASNALLGPYVNFQSGSGIAFAAASNTLTISATASGGGGASVAYGSNAARVAEISSAGIEAAVARHDHIHDGIGTITASSSNTMQRGTFNLRSGTNISFGLTDTDGDGELDTMTINNTGSSGGSSSSGSDPVQDAFGTPDTAFEFNSGGMPGGLTAMGSADVESANGTIAGHLLIEDDDSTQVGRYASVSAPCTIITKITDFRAYENYQYVGVMVGEATPGKIVTISLLGGASPSLVARRWDPFSSGSPTAITIINVPTDSVGFAPWYLGIKVTSTTDIALYASRSGVAWMPLNASYDPTMTIGSAGVSLGNYAGGSQPRAAAAYDYIRIWNSAKTFPAFS